MRGRDKVALVATVDEDFGFEGVERARRVAEAGGAHGAVAGGAAGVGIDERPFGFHRNFRKLGEHLLEEEQGHLRFSVRAAEGVFHLLRVFAVGFRVVGERAPVVLPNGAGQGVERPKIGVLETVRRHASEADRGLGEEHGVAAFGGGDGGGDAAGRGAVDDDIGFRGAR